MILLALIGACLALFAAGVLVFAMRRGAVADTDREHLNVSLYRERAAELAAELAAARIDAAQHAALLAELQQMLVDDVGDTPAPTGAGVAGRRFAPLLLLLVPALVGGLYAYTGLDEGTRAWLALHRADAPRNPGALVAQGMDPLDAGRVVQANLAHRHDAVDDWMMLGMHWLEAGAPGLAVEAMRTAHRHAPERHDITLALARIELALAGNRLDDTVRGLLDDVLAADPGNQQALLLYGMAAFQSGEYAVARQHWGTVLAGTDPASEGAAMLRDLIGRAEKAGTQQAGSSALRVRVESALEPGPLPGTAALFVVVRAVDGPPMPLAARRLPPRWPVDAVLTDADAVMGGNGIAGAGPVRVKARLSLAGNPMPGSGDLESEEVVLTPPFSAPTTLTLSRRLP